LIEGFYKQKNCHPLPHASLGGKVPVVNPKLQRLPTMPARWTMLIELAQQWMIEQRVD